MRLPEQRLWDTMKRNAPLDRGLWLQRIENIVAEGMPDLVCISEGGITSWIELKATKVPKRASTRVLGNSGLSPAQIAWHYKARSLGARSFILVRLDSGWIGLIPGSVCRYINDWDMANLASSSVANTWPQIFAELQ